MRSILGTLIAAAILIWLASSALFTVDRAEFVYLTQFGRHVATYDGKTDAGLHVKWPWPIQSVLRLDNRLQFFDLREIELLTHDREGKTVDKPIMISAYVCWRIAGSGGGQRDGADQFVRAVSTPERARSILEQRILSRLGAEIGDVSLDDLISTIPGKNIDQRMEQIRKRLLETSAAPPKAPTEEPNLKQLARAQYGIDLVDIGLRRFNYPPSVRPDISARIVSERERKVADYESEGLRKAVEIDSEARRQARAIETEAEVRKKQLEEEAAVKADAIRNEAHSRDPEFYAFLQKLEAYQKILGSSKDVLLLSSNHELFDMLLKPPRLSAVPPAKLPLAPGMYETLPPPRGSEPPAKTAGGP
jgi:membrane protease subunit HflC